MPDGATLAQARQLVSQHNYHAAQQVLRDSMGRARQDPAQADPAEAEAAALYAGVLLQLAEPATAGNWATYAYAAMRRLHGERDHRTLHALGVLAVTQHRAGSLDLASRHYQQLVAALSAVDGPDSERALAAKADAAGVDHALGRCSEARASLAQVIEAHKLQHGPAHPVGLRMTARLAVMWRDCGDYERARDLVTQARSQAKVLVPADETHRLLDSAATATANKDHQCGMIPKGGGPAPTVVVPRAQDVLPPRPRNGAVNTPHITEWPEDDVAEPSASDYLPPPTPPPPPTLAPPPPPQLLRPQPQVAVRERKVKPPPDPAKRKALAAIVFGALAAVAVGLVAVAILTSGSPDTSADAAPSEQPAEVVPSAAPPAAVQPSGPVANLKLVDNGTSVAVNWIYPANAKGPIIVSAAVAGEPMRAMQSLPAGTESYTLPGLNPDRDYCVTVAVAYSTDHVVMASPVCTSRKKN
jgi:hypothetical protein